MRVGVYIDGFNLYYGARGICGKATPGWRWLDLRALSELLIAKRRDWSGATVERIVYCTARIDQALSPVGYQEQDAYLRALIASKSVSHVEMGYHVARVKHVPLAVKGPGSRGLPVLVKPAWPLVVHTADDAPIDSYFMVSVMSRDEKGSDVNVGSYLLIDTLEGRIDAALVISNDSDLRFPLDAARERIPVALVNPSRRQIAGALRGKSTVGAGGHWWCQLTEADLRACQLPDSVDGVTKPSPW